MSFDLPDDDLMDGVTVPLKPNNDLLVVHREGYPDLRFVLDKAETIIGRGSGCDVLLDDPQVSRRHVRLVRDALGVYSLEDLGSRNGTYLNDRRLPPHTLQRWEAGMWVRVGPYLLSLKSADTLGDDALAAERPAAPSPEAVENEKAVASTPQPLPPAPVMPAPAQPPRAREGSPPAPTDGTPGLPPGGPRPAFDVEDFAAQSATIEVPLVADGAGRPDFDRMSSKEIMEWADDALKKVGEGTLRGQAQPQESPETQFAAYYPREVAPDKWLPLTAYVFKSTVAELVARDAERQLGGLIAVMRRIAKATRRSIPKGTFITATPLLPGFQFNPPQITIGYFEDWHRFDFKLRAQNAPLNQAANGTLTFTVEGVIVADVPLSVYVGDAVSASANVLTTQKLYEAIFCSYSRADTGIVERVERVYRALGFDYLRDVHTIKSGQDWNDELYNLIDRADIFQLFWSEEAAKSEHVALEWRHALTRNLPSFIRPVYWQIPMPPVPSELNHIHFAFEPTLGE